MSLEMRYFILKPRGNSPHAFASRRAMKAYAIHIKDVDPVLAQDLEEWLEDEALKGSEL